jgi:IS5 family transposase
MFGYKNHIGIDRAHGMIRTRDASAANAHDGARLSDLIASKNTGSNVRADTAYRSKKNEALLARGMFKSNIHHRKPNRRAMPERIARANAKRLAVRSAVEHVFAEQKHRMGLFIRTIGIARARIKIGRDNLAYNFQRLAWLKGRGVPAWPENGATSGAPAQKTEETKPETLPLKAQRPQKDISRQRQAENNRFFEVSRWLRHL